LYLFLLIIAAQVAADIGRSLGPSVTGMPPRYPLTELKTTQLNHSTEQLKPTVLWVQHKRSTDSHH